MDIHNDDDSQPAIHDHGWMEEEEEEEEEEGGGGGGEEEEEEAYAIALSHISEKDLTIIHKLMVEPVFSLFNCTI